MRGWSTADPSVHFAFYRFDTLDAVNAALEHPAGKALSAEVDRVWGSRVVRTRVTVPIEDELKG